MNGLPLPDGWLGKNWACHQLAQEARGDILIFTDADVRWNPGALRALIADMGRTQADLFTIWPTQQTESWPERLVVPLMALAIIGYLPIIGTHFTRFPYFAAACGQCMAWRREAYHKVGGHSAVRDNVLEDVILARRTTKAGLRLRMSDGADLIGCRMYHDWPSVRDGFAKNILAGYGNSIPALLLSTLFHWTLFVMPWVWLLLGGLMPYSEIIGWPALPLLYITLGTVLRMITAAFTRQRILDGLLMPLSVMLMTAIAFRSIYWHQRLGGSSWKGRIIKKAKHA
jgi:chlorobactene glucosyltransferase